MPSQLYENDKIDFVVGKPFTYLGHDYKVAQKFSPEKIEPTPNVEVLVRNRFIIPVVDDWEDKPRHWVREVRLRSELMPRLKANGLNRPEQINLERPDDVKPGDYDTSPEETEDNAAALQEKALANVRKNARKKATPPTQEVQYIDGKVETEPPELVGPGIKDEDVEVRHEPQPIALGAYDPADHNVDEVLDYLTTPGLDDRERQRIIRAEKSGKNRKGILDD